jgi:tRNA-specific 2-thiouridylase
MKKAMIAMSGGVDSSVAAYLAMEQGFDCAGGTMLLWENSASDAESVCSRLGIPFYVFDGAEPFRQKVVVPFIRAYEQGLTPNPCIFCNGHLKFSWFLDRAEELGCDYVVTGHYARLQKDPATGRTLLLTAPDKNKDQSYFLAGLNQHQLSHSLFPLGELTKAQVREIAEERGFINAKKKDSQDICFIPDGDYKAFMERYTGKTYPCGAFLDVNGKVVGHHQGAVGYTLGQRKGLGLSMGAPVYVCGKNMAENTVTVGEESLLFAKTLWAENCNFIPFDTLTEPMRVMAKARSRHGAQPATVYPAENGIRVAFDTPQRAITPGQAVVLYDGDIVIASGTITKAEA